MTVKHNFKETQASSKTVRGGGYSIIFLSGISSGTPEFYGWLNVLWGHFFHRENAEIERKGGRWKAWL